MSPRVALLVAACGGFPLVAARMAAVDQSDAAFAAQGDSQSPFARRFDVPPIPAGLTWVNSEPLQFDQLQGKFVLLDFWTYCCINCMHILPELKRLEQEFPNNLVVIGVHSPKFATEQDVQNLREAVARYEIAHPVVNDAQHQLWNQFEVRAWPTVLLIDPEGKAVWGHSGEITADQVAKLIKGALPYYRRRGALDEKPLKFQSLASQLPPTPLRFPGKVLADEPGNRLFIADSNHNRIVIATLDGKLLETIGSGLLGRTDGDFATAQFNKPQGMALRNHTLYVADTENHLIRKVDLETRQVATIAGRGGENRESPRSYHKSRPLSTALNSPWDLCLHDNSLYIAMAGAHQIWRLALDGSSVGPYAGNGVEDIVDGPLLPKEPFAQGYASFAQPSGLATDGAWLYVADSEGSSIRAVPLNPRRDVKTLVGAADLPDARLFTFGDVDGPPSRARLQHPLGVVYYEGRLFVADTYNNKIKILDPATGQIKTLVGAHQPGRSDSPPRFDEPAGITAATGRLYVADTNNHLIRVVDLRHDNAVSTLTIRGLEPPGGASRQAPRPPR